MSRALSAAAALRRVAHVRVPAARAVASVSYERMYKESIANPDKFWAEEAKKRVLWRRDFDYVQRHDLSKGLVSWFGGGLLNASENCIDRHLATRGNQNALIWESDEPGVTETVTYNELHAEVCRLANVLIRQGVKKGDRVCIYMPMTPHAVYAMLACARIGAIHSVVFAGFSAEALASRIVNANCSVLITADEGVRGGKHIPLRTTCAEAIEKSHGLVKTVIVQRRTGNNAGMADTDIQMEEAMAKERPYCPAVPMDAEDILFLLYTSGSTGTPKGLAHTTGGYLTYASLTHQHVFDYRPGDVYACVADVGWITGHSYIVYGPLMNGATTLLFESTPVYPNPGRYWDLVERHRINQFYTAPTAIRVLIKAGDEYVKKYDRSSLRVLGSVGEPINPEAWKWYHDVVGEGRCTIVDTWWQTETGGIMLTPLPGDADCKPGAAMRPFFGVDPVVLDTEGKELIGNGVSGVLAIRNPTPGMARTVFGNHERYVTGYFNPFPGKYFTEDGVRRDEDGAYWITGRVDDVINVAGHRLGTAEIESALVNYEAVAEAAVVGFPHEIKGQGIYAYVILKDGYKEGDAVLKGMNDMVRHVVGALAKPDFIQVVPNLPKTRSGKIMRRILRKIAADQSDFGDISTLAEPHVVQEIQAKHQKLVHHK